MGEILGAGEEADEGPALVGHVVSDRTAEDRVARLQRVQDRGRTLATPLFLGRTLEEVAGAQDPDAAMAAENEEIVVAGDDCPCFAGESGRQDPVVIGIAADWGGKLVRGQSFKMGLSPRGPRIGPVVRWVSAVPSELTR